jgi:hypothetical protein
LRDVVAHPVGEFFVDGPTTAQAACEERKGQYGYAMAEVASHFVECLGLWSVHRSSLPGITAEVVEPECGKIASCLASGII